MATRIDHVQAPARPVPLQGLASFAGIMRDLARDFAKDRIARAHRKRGRANARRYPVVTLADATGEPALADLGTLFRRQSVLMVAALVSAPAFGANDLFLTLLAVLFTVNATRLVLAPGEAFISDHAQARAWPLALALLPIIAGVMLGRGFLLLALMIVALDFACHHFTLRPVGEALMRGMILALSAEAGAIAVGGSADLSLTAGAGALGVLIAISRHGHCWSTTRIEPPLELFVRSAAFLLFAAAGLATIMSFEDGLPFGVLAGLVPLIAALVFLGLLARLLVLLDRDAFRSSLDDPILASLSAALLTAMLSLGSTTG
ncbi:MAG: hypothetical protein R3C70_08820 [Geminicoccaceae bacterium]